LARRGRGPVLGAGGLEQQENWDKDNKGVCNGSGMQAVHGEENHTPESQA
jgi:hypothetical protein